MVGSTKLARDDDANPIQCLGLGTVQYVAYTDTAAAIPNAVGTGTKVVRVYCTTDAHVAIGAAPVATTLLTPISAGIPEYFKVVGGISKVSAVRQAASGTLFVTETI